jgi:hypothetical protein
MGLREMITLTTKAGYSVTVSPETVFAIQSEDGVPLLKAATPPAWTPALNEELTWNGFSSALGLEDFLIHDPHVWFLRGLVLSCGTYIATEARPCRITMTVQDVILLNDIARWLREVAKRYTLLNKNGKEWEVKLAQSENLVWVQGRVLDFIVESVFEPVTLEPVALLHSDVARMHHLYAGMIRGAAVTHVGLAIQHRSAPVLSDIHHHLFRLGGLRSELKVNRNEEERQLHKTRIRNPHRLMIPSALLGSYLAAGVLSDKNVPVSDEPYRDPIASVVAAGALNAYELTGDLLTVDGFSLASTFTPPEEALTVATLPQLWGDVEDPERLLANSPVHMTSKRGAL